MATTFEAISRDPKALQDTISKNVPTLAAGTESFRVQRPFLADTAAFDAARYAPDPPLGASDGGVEAPRWSGIVASLERTLGDASPPVRAPALATSDVAPLQSKQDESKPFYASPWFWGAIGAAAFGGTAVYFATRDNSPSTIHLQLQVH